MAKRNKQLIEELICSDRSGEWQVAGDSGEGIAARKKMRQDLEGEIAGIGSWDGLNRQKSLLIERLTDPMILIDSFLRICGVDEGERNNIMNRVSRVRSRERGD
jgi:hypothetical protein